MAVSDPWASYGTTTVTGAGSQEAPATVALSSGNTAVAWFDLATDTVHGGFIGTVKVQVFAPNGTAVSGVIDVSPAATHFASGTQVHLAPLAGGGFDVIWNKDIPATYGFFGGPAATLLTSPQHELWMQRVDAAGALVGQSVRVDSGTQYGDAEAFGVTPLAFGGFAVDWTNHDAGASGHTVQVIDANGSVSGSPFTVGAAQASGASTAMLDLAATPWGGLAAVWDEHQDGSPSSNLIRYEHVDSQGTALDAPMWAGDQPGYIVQAVGAGALANGRSVVVEQMYDPRASTETVTVVTYDAHHNAIAATGLNVYPGQMVVSDLAGGGFLVSWVTIGRDALQAQRFDDAGHALGSPLVIATAPTTGYIGANTGNTTLFDVTATADGGATFVWDWDTVQDGNPSDVRMAHWAPANSPPQSAPVPAPAYTDAPRLDGTPGSDRLVGTDGNDTIVGGAGTDTAVFTGTWSQYGLFTHDDGSVTLAGPNGTDNLYSVERLQFSDVDVALDTSGNAGMAYRLYRAAFDRAPDTGGLGYHIHDLDAGVPFWLVAAHFVASPEFQGKYGALDDQQFITQLYRNVLHRDPDAAGLQFHLDEFARGDSRGDMLAHFSESPENQAAVIGVIQDGMVYLPLA